MANNTIENSDFLKLLICGRKRRRPRGRWDPLLARWKHLMTRRLEKLLKWDFVQVAFVFYTNWLICNRKTFGTQKTVDSRKKTNSYPWWTMKASESFCQSKKNREICTKRKKYFCIPFVWRQIAEFGSTAKYEIFNNFKLPKNINFEDI